MRFTHSPLCHTGRPEAPFSGVFLCRRRRIHPGCCPFILIYRRKITYTPYFSCVLFSSVSNCNFLIKLLYFQKFLYIFYNQLCRFILFLCLII